MRAAGKQYKEISEELGIDVSALKVFVHRQKHEDVRRCEQCRKALPKDARKTQRFCSDKCRNDWWYSHQGELQGERLTTFVCTVCGRGFTSYKQAKYCSRACFFASRRSKLLFRYLGFDERDHSGKRHPSPPHPLVRTRQSNVAFLYPAPPGDRPARARLRRLSRQRPSI